ncbi:hypothetical protein FJY94_03860 [Candidatus Kaiserbacteria bacterium]|nr:hypothetical protein [Candidatus Kaiserbacteria bacterium]
MFGLHSGSKREIVAVADIGSSSAAVAIVALGSDQPAVVLSQHRTDVTMGERSAEALASTIASALEQSAQTARLNLPDEHVAEQISSVYACVHAPWTRSTIAHALQTYDEDIKVTPDVIAKIGNEALSASGREHADFFETSVVRVELNGYPTGSPVGKTAHRILASALSSTCDDALYRAASDALARQFPNTRIRWRSAARAIVATSNALSGKQGDGIIIITIGREAASIIVVRRGVLDQEELLSDGLHALLRRIGGDSVQEMLNVLHLIGQDMCDSAACESMRTALARVEPDLVRLFGERFAKLATHRRLPSRIILLAHPDVQQWLSKFFARIDFTQFSVTSQPFSVVPLQPSSMGHLVITEGKLTPDASLLVSVACAQIESD